MKKLYAMMILTLTLAATAGSATPKKDLPTPECFPCSSGSNS
jgi:hypothetical protein